MPNNIFNNFRINADRPAEPGKRQFTPVNKPTDRLLTDLEKRRCLSNCEKTLPEGVVVGLAGG